MDSDVSSLEYSSGEEESDDEYEECAESPSSQSSRAYRASFTDYGRHRMDWFQFIIHWIMISIKFLRGIPFRLFQIAYSGVSKLRAISGNEHPSKSHSHNNRVQTIKDQIIHRATDRRRGVIEVVQQCLSLLMCAMFY